jgi:hypothetical protein
MSPRTSFDFDGEPMTAKLEFERLYYLLLPLQVVMTACTLVKRTFCRLLRKKPAYNSYLYDRQGACRRIRMFAQDNRTAMSLQEVYEYDFNRHPGSFDEWVERLWMKMPAAQAVRNRKAMVTSLLIDEVRRLWALRRQRITLAFLAGGFVKSGIEVARMAESEGIDIRCVVLDIEIGAPREYVNKAGVGHLFTFKRVNLLRQGSASRYLNSIGGADIIEMIGITDYLSKCQVISLMTECRDSLAHGGLLVTGNVLFTLWEAAFLYSVIDWPLMKHRTISQFRRFAEMAGFHVDPGDVLLEPHRSFMLTVIRNTRTVMEVIRDMERTKAMEEQQPARAAG